MVLLHLFRLTGHFLSGLVRQLTRGMPSLVPVPKKINSEVFCLLLPSADICCSPKTPSTNSASTYHIKTTAAAVAPQQPPHWSRECNNSKKKKLDIAKAGARMLCTCVGSEMTVPASACTRKLQTRMFLWWCLLDHDREAKNPPLETDDKWRAECKCKDDGECKSAILCMLQCMIQEAQARICKTGCI